MDAETDRAIRTLKSEYCYAIDGGDYGDWAALFTPEGSFAREGVDRYDGREELLEFAHDVFDPAYEQTAHVLSNPLIEADGDTATGTWYLTLRFRTPEGTGWKQAVYEDELRKVGGEWRFGSVTVRGRFSDPPEA
jgi:hypothetical protein